MIVAEKRWALSVPLDGFTLAELGPIAKEAQDLGYRDAWSSEVDALDAFSPLAAVATHTDMRVGTAIANVYTRGPATLAQCAAGIGELAPGRFVIGIGAGSQPIIEQWNDGKFRKPLTRVREMALFLRQALAGERVVFEGETFKVNGFRLSRPPSHPIPIHVAALREGMLRMAGEVADGCAVNWLSAEDVKRSAGVIRDGATAAGRDPNGVEITARLFVMLDEVSDETDIILRRLINTYLNVPVYRAFHEWLGRTEILTPMWDAWAGGDRKRAVAEVPQSAIDDLIIHGSAEERRAHVKRYMDAGIDTAFLQLFTAEQDPEKKRAKILQGVREMAPAAY
jgi:probable F420-dependent oxidoreductase